MRVLIALLSVLLVGTAHGAEDSSMKNCHCKNCACTIEKHCGCFSEEGCKCSAECSNGCGCGEIDSKN